MARRKKTGGIKPAAKNKKTTDVSNTVQDKNDKPMLQSNNNSNDDVKNNLKGKNEGKLKERITDKLRSPLIERTINELSEEERGLYIDENELVEDRTEIDLRKIRSDLKEKEVISNDDMVILSSHVVIEDICCDEKEIYNNSCENEESGNDMLIKKNELLMLHDDHNYVMLNDDNKHLKQHYKFKSSSNDKSDSFCNASLSALLLVNKDENNMQLINNNSNNGDDDDNNSSLVIDEITSECEIICITTEDNNSYQHQQSFFHHPGNNDEEGIKDKQHYHHPTTTTTTFNYLDDDSHENIINTVNSNQNDDYAVPSPINNLEIQKTILKSSQVDIHYESPSSGFIGPTTNSPMYPGDDKCDYSSIEMPVNVNKAIKNEEICLKSVEKKRKNKNETLQQEIETSRQDGEIISVEINADEQVESSEVFNIFSNSIFGCDGVGGGSGGGIPFIDDDVIESDIITENKIRKGKDSNGESTGSTTSNSSSGSSNIRRSNRIRSKSKKLDVYWNVLDMKKTKMVDESEVSQVDEELRANEEAATTSSTSTSLVPFEAQTTFEIINENEHRIERVVSREAKKMYCDCVLTKEEVAKGEFGCGDDCLNRLLLIECGPRCLLGERCSNKRFQYRQYTKCDVYKTQKKGFGLRSLENVPQGAFIMEYVGEVLDMKEFKKRAKGYSKDKNAHYYFMSLKSDCVIDATNRGNISRFINHSCDPNAETQKWTVLGELRIGFFSKRPIAAGEEITFDYKFQRYGREAQKCFCEASICRGWIGEEPDDEEEEEEEIDDVEEGDAEETEEEEEVEEPDVEKKEQMGSEKVLKRKRVTRKKKKRIEKEEGYYDWETTLERIMKSGLVDRHQTLNLNRLMLHAKGDTARLNILKLIECGDNSCKRLFVDYHGLQILYTWMTDHNNQQQLRLQVLKTLISLPVIDRTIVIDKKILPLAKKWAQEQEEDDQVVELANKICAEWSTLREAYRIPKKERIEQMKEHEREADEMTTYKTQLEEESRGNSNDIDMDSTIIDSRYRDRYERVVGGESDRKRKEQPVTDLYDGIYRKRRYDDKLRKMSKSQYRKMFERKVAIEEIRKKREEEEKQQILCEQSMFDENDMQPDGYMDNVMLQQEHSIMQVGYNIENNAAGGTGQHNNLYAMPPPPIGINMQMPVMPMQPVNHPYHMQFIPPNTSYSYTTTQQPHTSSYTLGNNIVIQPVEDITTIPIQMPISMPLAMPLNSSQTNPVKLPKKWKCATDSQGRVYYYHVKTRVSQWFPPPYTSDSTDSSNSSSSSEATSSSSDDDDDDDIEDDDVARDNSDNIKADDDEDSDAVKVSENHQVDSDSRVFTIKMDDDLKDNIAVFEQVSDNSPDTATLRISGIDVGVTEIEEKELSDDPLEGKKRTSNNNSSPTPVSVPAPVPVPVPLCIEHVISPTKKVDENKRRENKRKIRELKEKLKRHKRHKIKQQKKKNDEGGGSSHGGGGTINSGEKESQRNSAIADVSSIAERKIKDSFRVNMASFVVTCLNPYLKNNCTQGRITNSGDFKHLARKLTHFVMVKELKHCRDVNELTCNSSVKHKAKEFIKKYMSKFGQLYVKPEGDDNYF